MSRKSLLVASLSIVVLCGIVFLLSNRSQPEETPTRAEAPLRGETTSAESIRRPKLAEEAIDPVSPGSPPQVEPVDATRRMYAAHASLRTEVVDNPDSAANQRIQQELILKALSNASSAKSD